MSLSFLGVVFIWCSYPFLNLANVATGTAGDDSILLVSQVNIWLSLAASVLGCYTASAFLYRKFSVHDMVFSSIAVIYLII
jgi:hypothetical protein